MYGFWGKSLQQSTALTVVQPSSCICQHPVVCSHIEFAQACYTVWLPGQGEMLQSMMLLTVSSRVFNPTA